jgi:ATP-dependent helicase HrpA
LSGAAGLFAKWKLPPQQRWPGAAMPEFISANDAARTRGYPALTDEITGVGRDVFLNPVDAGYHHRSGLARLFRITQADQAAYIEKRPPLSATLQLSLSAIDGAFLSDLVNTAIVAALTDDSTIAIRTGELFSERSSYARTVLYEYTERHARILESLMEERTRILDGLDQLSVDFDIIHDVKMQLAFLFRPGFLQTMDVFNRYSRYLKGIAVRLQRIRSNAAADLRKLKEIEVFQNRLSEALLECDDISTAYPLLEFAMLLEAFRINRFAPEIKTPGKVSAKRLEEAWHELQYV